MSVSTVVRLRVGRLRNRGSIARFGIDFPLLQSVHIDYGPHRVSYMIATGGAFTGLNLPRRETDHSPPSRSCRAVLSLPYNSSLGGA
jgi:hypothetical protein